MSTAKLMMHTQTSVKVFDFHPWRTLLITNLEIHASNPFIYNHSSIIYESFIFSKF